MDEKPFIFLIFACAVFTLVGAGLNILVVSQNDGKMPVNYPYNFSLSNHEQITPETKYPTLADVFHIKEYYFSFGDILIFIGSLIGISGLITIFLKYKFHRIICKKGGI